jgi:hypothetical protein
MKHAANQTVLTLQLANPLTTKSKRCAKRTGCRKVSKNDSTFVEAVEADDDL